MKTTHELSICIPQTPMELTKRDLIKIFSNFGYIERIDINENFNKNRVFIHFNRYYTESFKNRLLLEKNIKLIYDFPNFLKCVVSNIPKHPRYVTLKEKNDLFVYQNQKE